MVKKIAKYVFWCIIIIALVFLSLYIPKLILNKMETREKALRKEADKNAKIVLDYKKIKKEDKDLNEYIKQVNKVKNKTITFKDKLVNIENCLPVDVVIESIDYDKKSLKIKAYTKNPDSISEFVAKIQLLDKYKDARVLDIKFDKSTKNYIFNIDVLY